MAQAFPNSRFVGFDYHLPSIERARAIRDALPAFVDAVVLTHDLPAERVRAIVDAVHPDRVQFHSIPM